MAPSQAYLADEGVSVLFLSFAPNLLFVSPGIYLRVIRSKIAPKI